MKETINFSFKPNPVWEQRRSFIAGGGKAEVGGRLERVGLENEFRGSRSVCSSFFMLSLNYSRRAAEWERQQAGRWRGGERERDREIDMMEWQTGRESGSGEEKWERQNGVYSSNMSELVCKMKQQKKKKSTNFHSADTPKTNTLHGALKSALCMKHGVTHVAWVLSAASVAGAQMAMDILATAPPRGRCGLRWRFTDSVGHLSLHDNLSSTSCSLP